VVFFTHFGNVTAPMCKYTRVDVYNNNNKNNNNNILAPSTRIFFSQSQCNPTVHSVQVPSPSSLLWANAWLVPPATYARCHIYSKDSPSLYSVSIRS